MNRRYQSLADYAAIGLAPLLIFWMLTSLAGFLMLVLYQGNYSQRVAWTLMCYTMGATALARVTIQESRGYSSIYAVGLGAATFFVLVRFLGDPIFSAALILTIGYLADRIVHDCTIVDDGIDSSGQGLVDSARKWIEGQGAQRPAASSLDQPQAATNKAIGKRGHQPGRTVLYLALGALPLFGIGQFFLRGNPASWERARWMLTLYLFTSLSLLVVTSFLNLRRYLRQRNTEMPANVTVSWLLGGVAMILLILVFAFIAPLPGQAIVSFELPKFLTQTAPTSASRFGWGDEGADAQGEQGSPSAAPRSDAETPPGAPESPQSGAPPGGDSGDRDEGAGGKESGGQESGGTQASEKSNEESGPKQSERAPPQGERGGETKDAPKSETEPTQPQQKNAPEESSDASTQNESDEPSQQKPGDAGEQSQAESPDAEPSKTAADADQPSEPAPAPQADSADSNSTAPPPPNAGSKSLSDWSGTLAGIAGLLKFLVIAALVLFVAFYVYLNREALWAWYYRLFGAGQASVSAAVEREPRPSVAVPDRPFSSFANPVGSADAGQVVVVTFQALEAWGREQGMARSNDETPAEYARRLVVQFPHLTRSTLRVVDAYNRVVYGRGKASAADVTAASSVWEIMRPQL